MTAQTPEVLFYHLNEHPLERVLPSLLEKTIERGWRAVVKSGDRERLEAIDTLLWTFSDDRFLAHGTMADGNSEHQPIYLTCDDDVPNGAGVMFLIAGASVSSCDGFVRVVHLFDGHDEAALDEARAEWKRASGQGLSCTYWQQDENGRWTKKA